MSGSADATITLPDGRLLGYREYGAPGGVPVLFFHGIPGSRLSPAPVDEQARRRGVRIIGIDRPGMGLSTYQPDRRFLDWPADIAALTAALGVDRFALVGISGGAAYVAACALRLPRRIISAGIVSGMGPMDTPGATEGMRGMTRRRKLEIALARRAPRLVTLLGASDLQRRSDPNLADVVAAMAAEMSPADRELLAQPEIAQAVRQDFAEAFRQGSRGMIWDLILYARPWGFDLRDIPIEVHVWHGDADVTVPIAFGQALAETIPHAQPRFIPDEGHMMAFSYADELLQVTLAAAGLDRTSAPNGHETNPDDADDDDKERGDDAG